MEQIEEELVFSNEPLIEVKLKPQTLIEYPSEQQIIPKIREQSLPKGPKRRTKLSTLRKLLKLYCSILIGLIGAISCVLGVLLWSGSVKMPCHE